MFKITSKKTLILAVIVVLLSPAIAMFLVYLNQPKFYEYSLEYIEIPSETVVDKTPLGFTYCFEVPSTLKVNSDLQEFFIALTKDELKFIMMSDDTGINKFTYQTKTGCESGYSAKIKAEDVEKGYALYSKGEL